jgi:hypothetical protein
MKNKQRGERAGARNSARIEKSRAAVMNFESNGMEHGMPKRKLGNLPAQGILLLMSRLSMLMKIQMPLWTEKVREWRYRHEIKMICQSIPGSA